MDRGEGAHGIDEFLKEGGQLGAHLQRTGRALETDGAGGTVEGGATLVARPVLDVEHLVRDGGQHLHVLDEDGVDEDLWDAIGALVASPALLLPDVTTRAAGAGREAGADAEGANTAAGLTHEMLVKRVGNCEIPLLASDER